MRLTPTTSEAVLAALTTAAIFPFPALYPSIPLALLTGGAIYFSRRSDKVRRLVNSALDYAPQPTRKFLGTSVVPPVEGGKFIACLPEPKKINSEDETTFDLFKSLLAEKTEEVKITPAITKLVNEPEQLLSEEEFLDYVTSDESLEDCPHIAVFAPSRAGKTKLVEKIVKKRKGFVVVIDRKRPKLIDGPKWGGLPYASLDITPAGNPDYRVMIAAMRSVVAEMNRRYRVQETTTERFPQLTVIVDEARTTIEECPEIAQLYKSIVSLGAEARIRLIIISTTDRARVLGFEGEADSKESLIQIRLGKFATMTHQSELYGPERWDKSIVQFDGEWRVFANPIDNPTTVAKAWEGAKYNCQTGKSTSEVTAVPTEVNFAPAVTASVAFEHTSAVQLPKKVLPIEAVEAARLWKISSAVDKTDAGKVINLIRSGSSKTKAIREVCGVTGGEKFARLSKLVDALQLLQRATSN